MEFRDLLRQAIDRKIEVEGRRRYTLRELSADSGLHFAHIQTLLSGRWTPTVATIQALCQALSPYLSETDALIAAGRISPAAHASYDALVDLEHQRAALSLTAQTDMAVRDAQMELDRLLARARELVAFIVRGGSDTPATPPAPRAATASPEIPAFPPAPTAPTRRRSPRRPR